MFEKRILCLNGGGRIGSVYQLDDGTIGYYVDLMGFGADGCDSIEEAEECVREYHEEQLDILRSEYALAYRMLVIYDPMAPDRIRQDVLDSFRED